MDSREIREADLIIRTFLSKCINVQICGAMDALKKLDALPAGHEEIRREAFEAGYTQGHNDTVESCARDYKEAARDYILSAEPARDDEKPEDER